MMTVSNTVTIKTNPLCMEHTNRRHVGSIKSPCSADELAILPDGSNIYGDTYRCANWYINLVNNNDNNQPRTPAYPESTNKQHQPQSGHSSQMMHTAYENISPPPQIILTIPTNINHQIQPFLYNKYHQQQIQQHDSKKQRTFKEY